MYAPYRTSERHSLKQQYQTSLGNLIGRHVEISDKHRVIEGGNPVTGKSSRDSPGLVGGRAIGAGYPSVASYRCSLKSTMRPCEHANARKCQDRECNDDDALLSHDV